MTAHPGPAQWTCIVCGQGINRFEDPHTFHEEGCPARLESGAECINNGCGDDVHAECCPTCTGQAFSRIVVLR